MEPLWTTAEEELLISLIHSVECGSVCRVVRSWTEIANILTERTLELGINERVYTKSSVACHYAQMPKKQLEHDIEKGAARMAEAKGSVIERPDTLRPMGKASAGWDLPPVCAKPCEPTTRATGPPEDFAKYKGRKTKG